LFGAKLCCANCSAVCLVQFGCVYKFLIQIDDGGKWKELYSKWRG